MGRIIEIAGGIASGKSTLARMLEKHGMRVVFENHELNPFWAAFYENPGEYIFETEVSFLMQHYHFAKRELDADSPVVLDHSFELDLAYSMIGLDGKRGDVFSELYDEVRQELGRPQKIVLIKCSAEAEVYRIKARGREQEGSVDMGFLSALNTALEEVIDARTEQRDIVEVDSEVVDFRDPGPWVEDVIQELTRDG